MEADLPRYLDQEALARRWKVSPRTLEGWRYRRRGPAFCRIGGLVRYPIEDVESYEAERLRTSTSTTARAPRG